MKSGPSAAGENRNMTDLLVLKNKEILQQRVFGLINHHDLSVKSLDGRTDAKTSVFSNWL